MAFVHWKHLEHREMRALVFMANMSLDADTPPVYFGGWEALANALGADLEGKRESARRTAVRVLGTLTKSGSIVSSGQARTGVRAEYALALDPSVTYKPVGEGRNVKWEQARTTPKPATGTGTHPEDLPQGLPQGLPIDSAKGETATGTQGETATGTQGETATGTQGETATVPNLRQLRVPQGTTSGTTEEYLEEKLEEYPSSVSQPTNAREEKNDDEKSWSENEPLGPEQERQRQMRELQKRIQAEQDKAS